MNLSHAYSDHAPKPKSYVGIGVVVALHLVGIYALSAGLIKVTPRERPVTTVKPLPPDVIKEPPPPPIVVDGPKLPMPTVIQVPVPPITIETTPTDTPPIRVEPLRNDPGPVSTGPTGGTVAPPLVAQPPAVRTAGAVCSVMPQPEVPAVNWTGEAVLQVLATVRGGRVIGSDVRVLHGALDGKTRRSLQRSVESALAGYQCQGDAMFQQDFAFRID